MKLMQSVLLVFVVSLAACSNTTQPTAPDTPATPAAPPASPLGEMAVPADNPMTPEKIALGKQLFFDKRLSKSGRTSCETCHVPEMGWTDGKALSTRDDGMVNVRHSPTLINVGFYKEWYWDGRAPTLEAQILAAWRGQMSADPPTVAMTLNGVEGYKTAFQQVFGGPATPENIPQALGAFVRTLKSENAPWDKYEAGDKAAVSADAIAGFDVFSNTEKANCTLCHLPPLYTDTLFHNVGVGYDKPMPDAGRGKILADQAKAKNTTDENAEKLTGAFKTPTLRSVTETAPYFHDGRASTLEEAIDYMLAGGTKNPHLDEKLQPRNISAQEKTQLMAFLRSLTPEPQPFERPQIP